MAFHNVPPNGFPDLPDVEELEAVEKDVATLKTTATSQGEAITALQTTVGTKAPKEDVAPIFSAEVNYSVGDLVYYEGVLYECTTTHDAEEWDAEDFTAASVSSALSDVNSNLTGYSNVQSVTGTHNTTVTSGGYISVGKCVTVSVAVTLSDTEPYNHVTITGFPAALMAVSMLLVRDTSDITKLYTARLNNGSLYFDSDLSAGSYEISGQYIAG